METISSKKNKTKKVISKSVKLNKKAVKSGEDKIKISKNEAPRKKFFRRKARATVYIGHIPHGFYESEMTSYFTQFGKVLNATVARSKKTGRSKGYGFVEFANEEVAKIAAETMNNYLMFNRIIKCRYIPPEERKGQKLRVIDPNNYPKKLNRKIDIKTKSEAISKLDQQTYLKKAKKKINQFTKFFEREGIDFNLKLNSPDSSNNEEKNKAVESESNPSSKSDDDTDKEFGVLEIDESDNEIHFKTPPQVKKVIKRSLNSPVLPSKRRKSSQNSRLVEKIEKKSSKLQNSSKEPSKKQETNKKSNVNKSKLLNLRAPENQETKKKSNVNKSKLLKLKAPENQETKKKSNVNKSKLLKLKAPQVKTTQKTNQKKLNLKSKNVVKSSKKIKKQGKATSSVSIKVKV